MNSVQFAFKPKQYNTNKCFTYLLTMETSRVSRPFQINIDVVSTPLKTISKLTNPDNSKK